MTNAIPKWIQKKYSVLWNKYGEKEFVFSDIMEVLKEKDKIIISMAISELRKAGWIKVRLNPEDSRKRIYSLERPDKIFKKIELK